MLRSVFAGVLAVSALAACKDKSDAPAVAVTAAAGKVVEITGKVDATRDGKTRELAMGAEVFADDQVATAADASVTIELFHNNARWAVVSNKRARVDASLAWGLDKQEATKPVEHNSAAAGRNAERSAADTAATADEEEENEKEDMAPSAAAESAPAPVTGAPPPAADMPVQPPPPPPPPKVERSEPKLDRSAPKKSRGAGGSSGAKGGLEVGGKAAPAAPMRDDVKLADAASIRKRVEPRRAELEKCLDPQAPNITVVVRAVNGKATVTLGGDGNRTDKVRACAQSVVAKIDFGTLSGVAVIDFR